jgi:hypothetical protein
VSKVIATIKKGGKGKGPSVEFKTEGVPGLDCRSASKPYMDAFGGNVVNDVATPEANQPAVTSEAAHLTA